MPDVPSPDVVDPVLEVVTVSGMDLDASPAVTAAPSAGQLHAPVGGLRGLVDTLPHDLAAADDLLLRIGRLQAVAEPLLGSVEQATGLRRQMIFVLQAVNNGHGHARTIGREVGADTGSVQASLDRLREQGYVQLAPLHPGDLHVEFTDAGRAVLEHVEAMTLRSTDALLQLIGPERAGDVVAALGVLLDALTEPLAAHTALLRGAHEALPTARPRSLEA